MDEAQRKQPVKRTPLHDRPNNGQEAVLFHVKHFKAGHKAPPVHVLG